MTTRKILAEFDAVDGPFTSKMRSLEAAVTRFEVGTVNAFGRVEKGVDAVVASMSKMHLLGSAAVVSFGAVVATGFIDQTTRIRNALRSVGEDSDANFKLVYLAATRSLVGMDAFAAAVQRFHNVLRDRQSFQETVRQVETLDKMLALTGKSAEERASATEQFAQALQSGRLGGDEFKTLRESAPVELLRAMATELGTTTAGLQKFSTAGKITTDVMVAALKHLETEADTRMKSVNLTFADAAQLLKNGALVAAESFDKGSGLSRAGTGTLKAIGEILASDTDAAWAFGKAVQFALAATAAGYAGRKIGAGIQAVGTDWPKERAEAVRTSQVEVAASNAARAAALEKRDAKLQAVAAMDTAEAEHIAKVQGEALAEADAATAARAAAQAKVVSTDAAIAASSRELVAVDKVIAAEVRKRALLLSQAPRRVNYGDASVVMPAPSATNAQFDALVAKKAATEARMKALDAERIASEHAVTVALGAETARRSVLSEAETTANAAFAAKLGSKRITLAKQLAAAEDVVTAATVRQAAATDAAAVAQGRLAFSVRALAAGGTLMKGAFSFLGGWPGLLLLAGIAFMSVKSDAEKFVDTLGRIDTATQAMDSLKSQYATVTDEILKDTAALAKAHADVARAIRDQGTAAADTSRLEVAAAQAAIDKNDDLLAKIAIGIKLASDQKLAEIDLAKTQLARKTFPVFAQDEAGAMGYGGSPEDKVGERRSLEVYALTIRMKIDALQPLSDAERAFYASYIDLTLRGKAADKAAKDAADALAASRIKLAGIPVDPAPDPAAPDGDAAATAQKQLDTYNQLLAAIQSGTVEKVRQAALDATIALYGDQSLQAMQMKAQIERANYADTLASQVKANDLTQQMADKLQAAYDAANGVAAVDMATGIWSAFDAAKALAGKLWDAAAAKAAAAQSLPGTGFEAAVTQASYVNWHTNKLPDSPVASGGGGGGGGGTGGSTASQDQSQKDALAFVEQMMTAEERQAKQLADTLALRDKIIKTYGAESPLVAQMDTAIGRLRDQMDGLTDAQQQFFDNMAQGVASAITDWKGWGDFVRSMLANLVTTYGPDFFMALLSPGKQTGTGLGTILGNAVTSGIGGLLGGASAQMGVSVPAAAKIAHITAMANPDLTPIRQSLAAKSAAESFTFAPSYDFRGADPSVIPRLQAELAKRDRELPGKVIEAVREARRRRVPL